MGYIKQKIRSKQKLPTWLFWFPSVLMRFMLLFYRIRVHDPNHYCQTAQGMIGLMWHNRLMFFAPIFPKIARRRTKAVVSASRDGQYVADFIKCFGIGSLRGSSSKKGVNALLGAIHAIKEGKNVVFTPDGPRGPKYQIKNGPVAVASKTGALLVPFVLNSSRCWKLKSWDEFQIPKPFSKLKMVVGKPIEIPSDLNGEDLEKYRLIAENSLKELTCDPE